MGKRGPQKTPTNTLEKRGSWRAKTREDEPVFDDVKSYQPPKRLGDEGKKVWNKLFPVLQNKGVIKEPDLQALERYCFWWDRWNMVIDTCPGDTIQLKKIEEALSKLEASFGLTPATRANIKVEKTEKKDEKERFFKVG